MFLVLDLSETNHKLLINLALLVYYNSWFLLIRIEGNQVIHQNQSSHCKQYSVTEINTQTLSCKDRNTKPCFITEPLQDNRDHTTEAMISKIKCVYVKTR